jgi:hypothetical protein
MNREKMVKFRGAWVKRVPYKNGTDCIGCVHEEAWINDNESSLCPLAKLLDCSDDPDFYIFKAVDPLYAALLEAKEADDG